MQAMPTFEQAVSPEDGFWQVRQPSLHSRHVASGGASTEAAAGVESDSGAALGSTGKSAANAAVAGHATRRAISKP
jgi:hypothetical protein